MLGKFEKPLAVQRYSKNTIRNYSSALKQALREMKIQGSDAFSEIIVPASRLCEGI